MRITEYIPRPFSFGIEGRKKLPIREQLRTTRKKDAEVIGNAKQTVAALIAQKPQIQITHEELSLIQPTNPEALYAHPAHSLLYKSPHNIRHFAATDFLTLFIGKYVNTQLVESGKAPLDLEALRYSAWTHDSFRSRFDILGTIMNYQLHGIRASEQLDDILIRGGLPKPTQERAQLVREIDRYHDVDKRPFAHRSPETEVFTTIDKLEMVRLFHPIQLRFKLPGIAQGIHMLAKRRMGAYEGSRAEFMDIMGNFLPIVDGLYRLSMQYVSNERKNGKKWEEIDQRAVVFAAAEELGLIKKEPTVATISRRRYSTTMPEVTRKKPTESQSSKLQVQENTLLDGGERSATSQRVIARLKEIGGVLPTRQTVERYQTQKDFFKNPNQTTDSMHNIRHHAGVAIGTVVLSADIAARQPELLQSLGLTHETMQDMLLRVASVHDTARMWDNKESEPTISDLLHRDPYRTVAQHGRKIAQLLKTQPQEGPDVARFQALHSVVDGLSQDQQDVFFTVVGNHDVPLKRVKKQLAEDPAFKDNAQKQQQALFLLDIFKIADNMELVRFFYMYQEQRKMGQRPNVLHEIFVNHRLFHYKTQDPKLQDLFTTYTPVIAELYQQTRSENAKDQFTAVVDAAEHMGILSA